MGRTKKNDDGFDTRTALLIPADAVTSFIQNGDAEVVGQFVLEYGAYALYGLQPEIFGKERPGMDRKEIGLVHLMLKCMDRTDKDKIKYEKKSESMRENANRRHHPEWYNDEHVDEPPAETEPEHEPEPASKKRTTRKTSKKEEKKETAELTPEEIDIKEKNDKGRKIYFDAWAEYDPDDKSSTKSRLIRNDKNGRNELMERIADIGIEDMISAVHRYMSDTDPKYRKSAFNFFRDRIFENYIGVNYKPLVCGHGGYSDVEFDLQEQYKRQNERKEAEYGDATDEELEKRFENF